MRREREAPADSPVSSVSKCLKTKDVSSVRGPVTFPSSRVRSCLTTSTIRWFSMPPVRRISKPLSWTCIA